MSLRILEQDVPGIAARVRALPPERRRVLAEAAAALALRGRPVDAPEVAAAWAALRGEAPADPAATALQRVVDALDDEAARHQRALDEGRPAADPTAYDLAFERARACAALVAALDRDTDKAVADALYEATSALDYDTDLLARLVDRAVAGAADPAAGLDV